jgi:Phytanoyl-CoA dioxygenase (PhyH)
MLTREEVEQFNGDGYAVHPGFLSPDEVGLLLKNVETISRGNTLANHDKTRLEMEPKQPPDGTRVRRIYEPCTYYPSFRDLSESEKLLDSVQQLLGPDLTYHYSKINMKPPEIGSVVEWHQDLSYYPLTNRDSLAVLFYLDDADQANGCLTVIPGQHRGRLMNHTRDGLFQGKITEPVDTSLGVPVEGKAGTAIFMHAMTPHASTTNTSNRWRRTLILSYRAADAFQIYVGENTLKSETHVRHVRGNRPGVARFSFTEFPVPVLPRAVASLYELQEISRKEE